MKKVLVTGGLGFIGSHTSVELLKAGYSVTILDNLSNSQIDNLDAILKITRQKPEFYNINLDNVEALESCVKCAQPDIVIHFAGSKSAPDSIERPVEYYQNNVANTLNLLRVMDAHGVAKVIFSSSATVYGNVSKFDVTELDEICPLTPYGKSKSMCEQILKDWAAISKDRSVTILRYFNPVGAHPSGLLREQPAGVPSNLFPVMVQVISGTKSRLSIFGSDYDTHDGTPERDYIHVCDLAKAHVVTMLQNFTGVNIYNVGTGKAISVKEVLETFKELSSDDFSVAIEERRPGDIARSCANVDKILSETGWAAEYTLRDMVTTTLHAHNLNHR